MSQMNSIAQELCKKICEEKPHVITVTGTDNERCKGTTSKCTPSKGILSNQVNKTLIADKKKPNSKVNGISKSICKFKSKDTLAKEKYIDVAINTVVSGPIKKKNDVTSLKQHNSSCCCKCSTKHRHYSGSIKGIQTFNSKKYSLLDKSVSPCLEMVTTGTQYFSTPRGIDRMPLNNKYKIRFCTDVHTQTYEFVDERSCVQTSGNGALDEPQSMYLRETKNWAISRNHNRGPDF